MEKVSLPKGTRDFGPAQMAKRQFIIDGIRKVFQNYGFQPLETPAMENLSTLEGKYGDEGDKLLFRILDSGEFFEPTKKSFLHPIELSRIGNFITGLLDKVNHDLGPNKYRTIEEYEKLIIDNYKGISTEIFIDDSSLEIVNSYIQNNLEYIALKIMQWLNSINKELKGSEVAIDHFNKRNFTINDIKIHIQDLIRFDKINKTSSKDLISEVSEKGLRYDLTVPFARYVVMNRHEITFPFKRYQIQPVWRADRPQKGRYREFYQCDADVVGTDSLVCEAEIIMMINDAFHALGISDYTIKINHRAILSGLAEIIGAGENETSLFVAIDKLDKIGEDKVKEELSSKGFTNENLSLLFEVLNFRGNTSQKIDFLADKFSHSEKGKKGLTDFTEVLSLLNGFGKTDAHVEFDIALARGLSYYTGCIFEVKINNVVIGSVSGGGRYDNLTAVFDAKEKSSGVGFSFGIDRIYDAMEELKIFPKDANAASTVLIAHLDEASFHYGLKIVQTLRDKKIAGEIYPDPCKIKKQMEYADKKKIPFVIVIGSEEVKTGLLTLKNMETGGQEKLSLDEIISFVKNQTGQK